ncbi:MAG: 2-oxo acid dehydrogenase subunit E2 [bacterium]
MKIEIVMPKMGESIIEGTLIKWHKKKGDYVKKDEIIYEISTDKVDTEIPSPADGILSEIKVFEHETVAVETVVAIIETETALVEPISIEIDRPSTNQVGGELIDIPMPKMGESIMEGTIIKWHKKVGDKVARDEIIFEISTDKVDTEVPSPVEGTIAEILFGENETVEVGNTVARISSSGGIVKSKERIIEKTTQQVDQVEIEKEPSLVVSRSEDGRINKFYSPLVLNIARKESIPLEELERIKGTGVGGRVSKKDILAYLEVRKSGNEIALQTKSEFNIPRDVPTPPAVTTKFSSGGGIEIIPMDNIRQRIMEHMIKSRDTSVHVSAMIEVDMSRIHNFIQKNKERFADRDGMKLTYMPFIAHACIQALKKFPFLNASVDGKNIVLKKSINLGFAVAVEPNGLIVPNIKNADEKSVIGLTKSIAELSHKARNKGLVPDDIMNGTFSITNYGVFGTLFGTPIINQPEVAILGVGAVTKKPVVIEVDGTDTIAVKPMMYLSLSHDHRTVDGMLGGKFLKEIKDTLENYYTNSI